MALTAVIVAVVVGIVGVVVGVVVGVLTASRNHETATRAAVRDAVNDAVAEATKVPSVKLDTGFIERYAFPPGMLERALGRCPKKTSAADLETGLREFLTAAGHAMKIGATVGMPSKVVDEAWHEFMLYTRSYAQFCERAYRRMLHHEPEVAMTAYDAEDNQTSAMARTWNGACKFAGLDPYTTKKVPVLFRIDLESGIAGAKKYVADCDVTGKCAAKAGTVCVKHGLRGVSQEVPKPAPKPKPAKAPARPSSTSTRRPSSSSSRSRGSSSYNDGGASVWAASAAGSYSSSCDSSSSSSSSCGGGGGCGGGC